MSTLKAKKASRLANVFAALAVAEAKLALAVAEFVPWPLVVFNDATGAWEEVPGKFCDSFTLCDARRAHRRVANLLKRFPRGTPTVPRRILDTIAGFENRKVHKCERTTPHWEGAWLALKLAERLLGNADCPAGVALEKIIDDVFNGLFFLVPDSVLEEILAKPRTRSHRPHAPRAPKTRHRRFALAS